MGKGGKSHEGHEEGKNGEEENMAAWLVAINTLKIQPFKLPPLGIYLSSNNSDLILLARKFLVKSVAYFLSVIRKDPTMSELE